LDTIVTQEGANLNVYGDPVGTTAAGGAAAGSKRGAPSKAPAADVKSSASAGRNSIKDQAGDDETYGSAPSPSAAPAAVKSAKTYGRGKRGSTVAKTKPDSFDDDDDNPNNGDDDDYDEGSRGRKKGRHGR
jgi:hypothetical protein